MKTFSVTTKSIPTFFVWLELFRFFCSFMVICHHYGQYFLFHNPNFIFIKENQPFYSLFSFFYDNGTMAVLMFWSLSGFIFQWKYSVDISNKILSSKRFFIDRFSRLYPLHFATLILVCILQQIYSHMHNNTYFIYQSNDIGHFILNIFFASSWFGTANSFNGPIWSVSAEVIIYCLFFIITYYMRLSLITTIILAFIMFKFSSPHYIVGNIMGCGAYFFTGAFTYLLFEKIQKNNSKKTLLVITLYLFWLTLYYILYKYTNLNGPKTLIICSVLLFTLAQMDKLIKLPKKICKTLGDLTYASYLIHFSIQIIFLIITDYFFNSRIIYYNKYTFIIFFTTVFVLSYLIFKYFERPAQNKIRKLYFSRIEKR